MKNFLLGALCMAGVLWIVGKIVDKAKAQTTPAPHRLQLMPAPAGAPNPPAPTVPPAPVVATKQEPPKAEKKQLDISRPMETEEFAVVCPGWIDGDAFLQAFIDMSGPSWSALLGGEGKTNDVGCRQLHGGIPVKNVSAVSGGIFKAEVLGHEVWITEAGLKNVTETPKTAAVMTTPVPETARETPASSTEVPGTQESNGRSPGSIQQSPVDADANGLYRIDGGRVSAPTQPLTQGDSSNSFPDGWRIYRNTRFGFAIAVPNSFEAKRPPENGDGNEFASKDGNASLVASGSNSSGMSISHYFESQSVKDQLTYKRLGENWFVLSWRDLDRIKYQKTFIGSGSINTFIFTYPESQRSEYDSIVKKLEMSFRPGDLNQGG